MLYKNNIIYSRTSCMSSWHILTVMTPLRSKCNNYVDKIPFIHNLYGKAITTVFHAIETYKIFIKRNLPQQNINTWVGLTELFLHWCHSLHNANYVWIPQRANSVLYCSICCTVPCFLCTTVMAVYVWILVYDWL